MAGSGQGCETRFHSLPSVCCALLCVVLVICEVVGAGVLLLLVVQ